MGATNGSARGRLRRLGLYGAIGLVAPCAAVGIGQMALQPAPAQVAHAANIPQPRSGYWMLGRDGVVYAFGQARSVPGKVPHATSIAGKLDGSGYWVVDTAGGVYAYGTAQYMHGSPALRPGEIVSTTSATPSGKGYWLFTSAGRVFAYGDARGYGDLGSKRLNASIIASVATPTGRGYYLVGSDGGVFAFGDARFHGSTGNLRLNQPIVGIAPTPDNRGYWLVARDGGVFAFHARFRGSMASTRLNRPIVGMVAYGNGYLMAASDGGVFDFSTTPFLGSLSGLPLSAPITAITAFATIDPKSPASTNPTTTTTITQPTNTTGPATTTQPTNTTQPTTTTTRPTTTTSLPSTGNGLHCAASPHLCGFADATNTGISASVTLTQVPSGATSGPGWSCTNPARCSLIMITGNVGSATTGLELADGIGVEIAASNVTVQNIKVDGIHGQNSEGIVIDASTSGVTVDHCELQGVPASAGSYNAQRGWVGVHIKSGATSYAVNHCNIHGFSAGIFPDQEAGTDSFVGNFVHQITCWDYTYNIPCNQPPSSPTTSDHCNDFGDTAGPNASTPSSLLLRDNTFWGDNPSCMSDAIALFPDFSPQINDYARIDHNLLSVYAYYCVNPGYGDAYGSYGRSYVALTNNHWSTLLSPVCGKAAISYIYPLDASSGAGNYQCGNVWDDGPLAGSGADRSNYYPTTSVSITACPSPAPW